MFIIVLSLIGSFVLLFKTRSGVGIEPDSIIYIDTARNLSKGLGLNFLSPQCLPTPLIDHLPFYPIFLSTFGSLGIDPLEAARWLNAFLFAGNIFLIGFLIYKYTRSWGISLLGSLIMLTSVDSIKVHLPAMSEPLFIFLTLMGFLMLASYLEKQKPILLLASAGFIALASVTRFAGIPVIITGMIGLLILSPPQKTGRAKIFDAAFLGMISVIPLFIWFARNSSLIGHPLYKEIFFHPIASTELNKALLTILHWFLFKKTHAVLLPIVAAALILRFLFRKKLSDRLPAENCYKKIPALMGIFILIYALSLLITICFFDPDVSLYYRYLFPIHALGIVLILCLINDILCTIKQYPVLKVISVVFGIILGILYIQNGSKWILSNDSDSYLGFASPKWKGSPFIANINNFPPNTLIYSNGYYIIYFLTGRHVYMLPSKINRINASVQKNYVSKLYRMMDELKKKDGILVYFKNINKKYFPTQNEIEDQLPLRIFKEYKDATIYKVRS